MPKVENGAASGLIDSLYRFCARIPNDVTKSVTKVGIVARKIAYSLAKVLERLELDHPELVTMSDIEKTIREEELGTPARIVAARLRENGWLISTEVRGVWEFSPASLAGSFSSNDPLLTMKAFSLKNPNYPCALTFQAGAWIHGLARRVPVRLEIAFDCDKADKRFPPSLVPIKYTNRLPYETIRGVAVLPVESILVNMCELPTKVRSWNSAQEWLPELAEEIHFEKLLIELEGRTLSVYARTGYLLQGLRPEIADSIHANCNTQHRVWFGPKSKDCHKDRYWNMSDSILPFDPKKMRIC